MTTPKSAAVLLLYHAGGLRCQQEAGEANGKLAKHEKLERPKVDEAPPRELPAESLVCSRAEEPPCPQRQQVWAHAHECAEADAEAKATEEEQADRHGDGSDETGGEGVRLVRPGELRGLVAFNLIRRDRGVGGSRWGWGLQRGWRWRWRCWWRA